VTRHRRKILVKPAGKPTSDINVTPLVDVVLVLLIIFMVVTPLLEKDIFVRVPPTEQVDQPASVPEDQLVVAVAPDGALSINSQPVTAEEYADKLARFLAAKESGSRVVFFVADDKTRYSKVVFALDGAKRAGAEILGMATDLPVAAPPAPSP
jgi:biopolymer transport protein ExbD